jgi:hypothetical protein
MSPHITFQVENYAYAVGELKALYPEHWAEIAIDKERLPLDPDYERYLMLAEHGMLHLVTVRDAGALIGYHLAILQPHLHYRTSKTAFTDIYFVKRDYRAGTGIGLRLFREVTAALRRAGVQKIYTGCKVHHDISAVLERVGYRLTEKMFTLLIEEDHAKNPVPS